MKTAIIIGATGLVGNELLNQLISDNSFEKIKAFVRKPLNIAHSKIEQHIVDFDDEATYLGLVKGDVLFCCLGTTIKTAGSQPAFKKVDFEYPIAFGKVAKQNGVETYVLISALGANKSSSNFYMKTKGEVENELSQLNFNSLIIVRPSMLLGNRKEFRLGELIGKVVMKSLFFLFVGPFKKYMAIEAADVAKAMLHLAKQQKHGITIADSGQLQDIARG